jgi:hypothetical protein
VPIAITDEQLAVAASIREWAKRAGTLELVRGLEPDPPRTERPGEMPGGDPKRASGGVAGGVPDGAAGAGSGGVSELDGRPRAPRTRAGD